MSLIPMNMIGQTFERVGDCGGSHVKRVLTRSDDKAEKDTVTLNVEHGQVTSVEEGFDVDRRCSMSYRVKSITSTAGGDRRLSWTRCQLVKLAKMLRIWQLEHEELRLLGRSRVTVLREVAVSRDPETGD